MAVITKYVVVRNGIELDKVFEDKKQAEAYDTMLDAAENLAVFIKSSDLRVAIESQTIDDIAVFLSKNALEVTRILKGVKPLKSKAPAAEPSQAGEDAQMPEKKSPALKAGPKSRQK